MVKKSIISAPLTAVYGEKLLVVKFALGSIIIIWGLLFFSIKMTLT
jgi:hypothetical protein